MFGLDNRMESETYMMRRTFKCIELIAVGKVVREIATIVSTSKSFSNTGGSRGPEYPSQYETRMIKSFRYKQCLKVTLLTRYHGIQH